MLLVLLKFTQKEKYYYVFQQKCSKQQNFFCSVARSGGGNDSSQSCLTVANLLLMENAYSHLDNREKNQIRKSFFSFQPSFLKDSIVVWFKSGDKAGRGNNFIFISNKNSFVTFEEYSELLSCWKMECFPSALMHLAIFFFHMFFTTSCTHASPKHNASSALLPCRQVQLTLSSSLGRHDTHPTRFI